MINNTQRHFPSLKPALPSQPERVRERKEMSSIPFYAVDTSYRTVNCRRSHAAAEEAKQGSV